VLATKCDDVAFARTFHGHAVILSAGEKIRALAPRRERAFHHPELCAPVVRRFEQRAHARRAGRLAPQRVERSQQCTASAVVDGPAVVRIDE
jgi:hypothetical protein